MNSTPAPERTASATFVIENNTETSESDLFLFVFDEVTLVTDKGRSLLNIHHNGIAHRSRI